MNISILDLSLPQRLLDAARDAEALGFNRYWFTEHHSALQSSSPSLAVAAAAMATSTIRLGTAGILLAYQSPSKIIEDFHLLEVLFGDRFDLGIAGASVREQQLHQALLDTRGSCGHDCYAEKARKLFAQARGDAGGPIPYLNLRSQPWICGTSERSARLAGELNVSYAFHHFLYYSGDYGSSVSVFDRYRDACAEHGKAGYTAITLFGICAETSAGAHHLWASYYSTASATGPTAAPCFIGNPEECREQLLTLAEAHGADEIVIHCPAGQYERRLESLSLLAEAMGLLTERSRADVD